MTLYEFIELNEINKEIAVWNGVYLVNRFEKPFIYQLYSLGSFFVEVTYNPKINEVTHLEPFTASKLLEPYINQISLEDLIYIE